MVIWAWLGRGALALAMVTLLLAGGWGVRSARTTTTPHHSHRWPLRLHTAAWLLLSGALMLLVGAFLSDAFAFAYVADRSNRAMATIYKVTALWAGQEGSLLLWLWMQTGYGLLVSVRAARKGALDRGAAGILALIAAFFAALLVFVVDPFMLRLPAPADGLGMNPILQSYWMATHPVMLYFGYVGLSVPFAYALSSLITGDGAWIAITRRWSLTAWTFLSVGILYGARWAYEELGWGGYWGWDPVENASLMPWLVATAFIHSGIIEEKRGMLKRWNHALVFLTYLLTIFGTFLTRSGILSSVHAFIESDISPWFIGFMGVVTAAFLYALIPRWESLRDDRPLVSPASKESSFLANNIVLIATTFAVFWGTVFPLVSSAMGHQVTVGTPYFNRVTGPLFVALILLMGIGPLISWRKATPKRLRDQFTAPVVNGFFMLVWLLVVGVREMAILLSVPAVIFVMTTIVMEFVKGVGARRRSRQEPWWLALWRMMNRSPGRYGGYVVHVGVLFLVVGIAFSQVYQEERNVVLGVGETAAVGPFSVTLFGVQNEVHGAVPAVTADLLVRDGSGKAIGYLNPSKRFYPGISASMGPTTESAIYGTWRGDLYAVLAGWEPFGSMVGLKLYYNPMVWLLWAGGGILVFGGLFSLWPRRWTLATAERAALALAEVDYDYKMGKLGEAEYRALVSDLAPDAQAYVAAEDRALARVWAEVWQRLGRSEAGRLAALLVVTGLLWASIGGGAAQAQRPELPAGQSTGQLSQLTPEQTSNPLSALTLSQLEVAVPSPGEMPAELAIPQETIVLQWVDGGLSLLQFVTVMHLGDEPATVRLALAEGAMAETFQSDRLLWDAGYAVDPQPLTPGESRRYTYQYQVPVLSWPFPLSHEVVYPTAELTVMSPEGELEPYGLDLEPVGTEEIAGQRFGVYQSRWIPPHVQWHAAIRPGPLLGRPALFPGDLPRLSAVDRFPGDWLLQRAARRPGWTLGIMAVAALMLGAMTVAAKRYPSRAASAGSAANRIAREIARLDLAFEAGEVRERTYRKRRAQLMERLALEAAKRGGTDATPSAGGRRRSSHA